MVRRIVRPDPSTPEFHPQTLPTQPAFNLADIARLFGKAITTVHYWLLSGKIREATRTSARGEWRVPRQEVIRLMADAGVEIPGLWTRPHRVLVIDDNEKILEEIKKELEARKIPLDLTVASDLKEGLRLARKAKPDVIVCDYFLPRGRGARPQGGPTETFVRTATRDLKTKVIGISGWGDVEDAMRSAGAVAFFRKPVPLEAVKNEIFRQAAGRRSGGEKRRPLELLIQDTEAS